MPASVTVPRTRREEAWARLDRAVDRQTLREITREIPLADAIAAARRLLAGEVTGRLVVNMAT
jgi:acrylyl-CoA reductase (NADPH)